MYVFQMGNEIFGPININGRIPSRFRKHCALQNFKTATKTVGKLRSLLGFISYYCTYIKNFSRILKPLYDILHERNSKNKAKVNNRVFQLKHKTHREIHH